MDVTAHELTHAVTQHTSNLIYEGESGGLNESMSDIFGNVCEWYRDNDGNAAGPTSQSNYLVDVHYSSGISNLAFYLLAEGGTHPRGKSSTVVTGIGIHDAAAIFYRANASYLVPSSNFTDARTATVAAATDLFGAGSVQVAQTHDAWTAVGVRPPPDYMVIDTRAGLASTSTALRYSYPTNLATAMKFAISGGTGNADLYVRFDAPPTLTAFHCTPHSGGNNEACEFNPTQRGTYHVMIYPSPAFSGVTLTVGAAGGHDATETSCTDGVDNDGDNAADCADSDCASTPVCNPPGDWVAISSTNFESGLGPFTASSFGLTTGMNLPGKTQLRVQYSEIANGMETGKGYYVELNANGSGWLAIGNFTSGLDFSNGVRQARDLRVVLPDTANVRLRFRCNGAVSNDEVYIDDVVISAQ